MPYGCKTEQRRIDPKLTGAGRPVDLPYCLTHGRWFFLCQHKVVEGAPRAKVVNIGIRKGI